MGNRVAGTLVKGWRKSGDDGGDAGRKVVAVARSAKCGTSGSEVVGEGLFRRGLVTKSEGRENFYEDFQKIVLDFPTKALTLQKIKDKFRITVVITVLFDGYVRKAPYGPFRLAHH